MLFVFVNVTRLTFADSIARHYYVNHTYILPSELVYAFNEYCYSMFKDNAIYTEMRVKIKNAITTKKKHQASKHDFESIKTEIAEQKEKLVKCSDQMIIALDAINKFIDEANCDTLTESVDINSINETYTMLEKEILAVRSDYKNKWEELQLFKQNENPSLDLISSEKSAMGNLVKEQVRNADAARCSLGDIKDIKMCKETSILQQGDIVVNDALRENRKSPVDEDQAKVACNEAEARLEKLFCVREAFKWAFDVQSNCQDAIECLKKMQNKQELADERNGSHAEAVNSITDMLNFVQTKKIHYFEQAYTSYEYLDKFGEVHIACTMTLEKLQEIVKHINNYEKVNEPKNVYYQALQKEFLPAYNEGEEEHMSELLSTFGNQLYLLKNTFSSLTNYIYRRQILIETIHKESTFYIAEQKKLLIDFIQAIYRVYNALVALKGGESTVITKEVKDIFASMPDEMAQLLGSVSLFKGKTFQAANYARHNIEKKKNEVRKISEDFLSYVKKVKIEKIRNQVLRAKTEDFAECESMLDDTAVKMSTFQSMTEDVNVYEPELRSIYEQLKDDSDDDIDKLCEIFKSEFKCEKESIIDECVDTRNDNTLLLETIDIVVEIISAKTIATASVTKKTRDSDSGEQVKDRYFETIGQEAGMLSAVANIFDAVSEQKEYQMRLTSALQTIKECYLPNNKPMIFKIAQTTIARFNIIVYRLECLTKDMDKSCSMHKNDRDDKTDVINENKTSGRPNFYAQHRSNIGLHSLLTETYSRKYPNNTILGKIIEEAIMILAQNEKELTVCETNIGDSVSLRFDVDYKNAITLAVYILNRDAPSVDATSIRNRFKNSLPSFLKRQMNFSDEYLINESAIGYAKKILSRIISMSQNLVVVNEYQKRKNDCDLWLVVNRLKTNSRILKGVVDKLLMKTKDDDDDTACVKGIVRSSGQKTSRLDANEDADKIETSSSGK